MYKINLLIITIFLGLLISDKSSLDIQNDINKKNTELERLTNEIKRVEKLINSKSKEEQLSNDLIKQIDNKISLTEKLIKTLNDEENYLIKLIYKAEDKIDLKEKEQFKLQNQLKNRVRYLYKYGKENLISQLIQSEDWNKIIYRTKYLKILNDYEEIIKKRINKNIKELKSEKNILQIKKNSKKKLIQNKNIEFKNLENEKSRKKVYLKKIQNQKNELRMNLQLKKDMIARVGNIIQKLYSDKNEAQKREEEIAKRRQEKNKPTSGNFAKMKGKLNWPTKGEIVGNFGKTTNANTSIVTENIGIDILTSQNEKVYSVLDGIVLAITYITNFGDLIIVDHGSGYFTVYSNLKNINVYENQYIDANTYLAQVAKGSNFDYPNQAVFNFQVWSNEKKVDPKIWLKK
jgi:septal ring factor EnvC (AmiA/AmiB activator)